MMLRADQVAIGDELAPRTFEIDRAMLVRYAGASGDFNVIHWNPRVAREVGLPDVIAHGMLTMALAARVVTDWVGDPSAIVEYRTRFTRPIVVPDPGFAVLEVGGRVVAMEADATVAIDLTATVEGKTVLAKARIIARLR